MVVGLCRTHSLPQRTPDCSGEVNNMFAVCAGRYTFDDVCLCMQATLIRGLKGSSRLALQSVRQWGRKSNARCRCFCLALQPVRHGGTARADIDKVTGACAGCDLKCGLRLALQPVRHWAGGGICEKRHRQCFQLCVTVKNAGPQVDMPSTFVIHELGK